MNKLTAILILLIALLVFDFAVGTGYAASKVAVAKNSKMEAKSGGSSHRTAPAANLV